MNNQTNEQWIKPVDKAIKESRGAQLRALILSWSLCETYQRTLQLQAEALQKGELDISQDWGEIADQLYQSFEAQKSKIILPYDK